MTRQLLAVFNSAEATQSLVSLRDVHRALNIKSHFKDWVKRRVRMHEYQADKEFTLITSESLTANMGRPQVDCFVKLNTAKEMVMWEPYNLVAIDYRLYLINCQENLAAVKTI